MKVKKNFEKAKILRQKGFSFKEIGKILGISKSTASLWLRNVKLSDKAKKRIENLGVKGRNKSIEINKKKRSDRLAEIYKNCEVLRKKKKYDRNDFKLFLALLYWGEGAKTGRVVAFINSDPKMIKAFLFLFRNTFELQENKFRAVLHLHDYHDRDKMIEFWSNATDINKMYFSVYKKKNTGKSKKEDYKGCISVRYCDVKIFDEILLIINRFIKFAGVG